MNMIRNLYAGNVFPSEEICPDSPQYVELNRELSEGQAQFKKELSPKDRVRFDELDEISARLSSISCYDHFAYGFRLGVLLMCDVISENNSPDF